MDVRAITSAELDAMNSEETKAFIEGLEVGQIDQVFSECSFAAIKRTWEKYSGCRAVSTWTRSYTIFQFKEWKWHKRRTNLLLNN